MSVNISYNDSLHSYSVSPAMLVKDLIKEISEKQSLYQFKLKLGAIELMENKPVSKYLITQFFLCYDDKEVSVQINDMTFDVMMTTPDNLRTLTEKASAEMTIGQLKERISTKFISTQGNWVLKKKGQAIPDKNLIKSHMDKKTFTVVFQDMNVYIQYDNRNYTITTRGDMTILQFIRTCSMKIGLDTKEISLHFNGQILGNQVQGNSFTGAVVWMLSGSTEKKDRTVASYQIKPLDVIIVAAQLLGAGSSQL